MGTFPPIACWGSKSSWVHTITEQRNMPTYEYHCKSCKKNFEAFQKISEKPLTKCPSCGKKVKRLISQTSFALKGGGWYKDGYSSGSSSSESSKKPEKKAAKPETKKD